MEDNRKNSGITFLGALQLTFIILKLLDVIKWSWWLVLLPLEIEVVVIIIFVICIINGR